MRFDVPTLFSLLLILSLALAVLLPLQLGWRDSAGARFAQLAAVTQAAGWALLLLPPEGNPVLAVAALGLLSLSLSLLWWATQEWLPDRWGRWLQAVLPMVVMLGYALGWRDAGFRLAWSNGCLGLQMLALAASVMQPVKPVVKRAPSEHLRWRLLLAVSLGAAGLLNLARAWLAGMGADALPRFDAPHPLNAVFAVTANVCVLTVGMAVLVAWRGQTEAQLRRLSQVDSATGLANRRAFQQRSVDMISMARRYNEPLMLLVMDLDGLKSLNQTLGEDKGDQAIQLFARCLDEQKRLGDLVARIDGQRFAVLMARSDLVGPPALDRRLRHALQEAALPTLGAPLSFSAGWGKLRPGDRNLDDLLQRTETALYAAKHQGRARLCAEPGLEAELSIAASA